jgi:HAMP domain-containing protein/signal transduction histidine kinase/CheY-like chemotaxis protein
MNTAAVIETPPPELEKRAILGALRALKRGDFNVQLPSDLEGTDGEIADAFNEVVGLNRSLCKEVTRVRRAVGRDGRIGERAKLGNASGSWLECVDSVNELITDTVQHTAEISRVVGAVAKGDLSQTMELQAEGRPLKGEFLHIAKTINTMVDRLALVSSEVTRVAREVGTEGKLGGQAQVRGVAGTWKDLTDNVNAMASNLTSQVRNIADVTTAVARGDLSKKITVDVKGEIQELKGTINTMVDQLNSFASEVTRVAGEVGTEGKLGGQARVEGVAGTWKDLTDNVNGMASNLTSQVRNIADVTTAVARGDLSKKITVDVKGEILELKDTINTMVDQLSSFASEVTRVAREVGTEGKLGGEARVEGVAGTWKDLTDNVNAMAGNLTSQVRNIAEVTTAVARGDLSEKITVDARGEILELKNTINTMVDQLSSFASEVTRVAREVGTQGKLGGQAQVEGVAGTWKDLTDNVNAMATNLTSQVRNIAEVTTAVALGDLSKKITVNVEGEILELKNTINTMVDQLSSFASEVTRVAREVGTEGKLGGEARVEGVAGTWKDLTDNVNAMASNLTGQVRNIAEVTTAVAKGDLSRKITVQVKGEILELKDTINTMVDQLNSFASEVTRVAREVGTEGKLGGEAKVEGVAGTWKDLTDNVNAMASNLTGQVRNIAEVTTAVARGDLSKKITVDVKGEILELKNTINTMVDQLNSFASEVTRVAREVGTEGKLGGEAQVRGVAGTWKDLTDNVNAMAGNLTTQVRAIADVTTAVARGDLSKKITVDVKGEILELKDTINTMVDQLNSFASEVTRVAREVGTEGKLGGQAQVRGVGGTWKDLTDNVNMMATNLTNQVRGIAQVVTAVANGNLKRKLTVDAKGEIAELAETINGMIETLEVFADQVTDVAREVGIDGKLGGQAKVPGAAGLWRDLTDNVNQLAANLTTQVRAIAEVATAVTEGDLTRTIAVEALGEVASLKDNINQMIANLRETTQYNMEQDWLKTNLARFTRMMQGERDLVTVCNLVLSEVAPLMDAQQGVFYVAREPDDKEALLDLTASYALAEPHRPMTPVAMRQGLVGQCAYEKKRILLTEVPPDYVRISSGVGEGAPLNIVVLPVLFEGSIRAVIELASFNRFSDSQLSFLDQLVESIGIVLNTIAAGMRTEGLLTQSQILTAELQSQQAELKTTNDRLQQQASELRASEELLKSQQDELRAKNEELEEKAAQLENEKRQVEAINREVETARVALEEKAEQLALTSRYKSEFLANMSHELRTPLNSLLILSRLLSENAGGNLEARQIEHARTIHAAGSDLMRLINDILDLSKIESGTVVLDVSELPFQTFREQTERTFQQAAVEKGIAFSIELADDLPAAIRTDPMRLQQVINNLLSNAFKFTGKGSVTLSVGLAEENWTSTAPSLAGASKVVAFSISDTGIGISPEQQQVIFEAFQQADGTTNRRYGGTGLGLSISRELATLLGGEIRLLSKPGKGSTFTLYIPLNPDPARLAEARGQRRLTGTSQAAQLEDTQFSRLAGTESQPPEYRDESRPFALIVEDDPVSAGIRLDIAQEQGFDGAVMKEGRAVLGAVARYRPDVISLDLQLADADGWALLDMLTYHPSSRHLPLHVVSAAENEPALRARFGAAVHYSAKPVTRDDLQEIFGTLHEVAGRLRRRLLVIKATPGDIEETAALGGINNVEIVEATLRQAGRLLRDKAFDCALLAAAGPSAPVIKFLESLSGSGAAHRTPLVIRIAGAAPEEFAASAPQGAVVIAGDQPVGHCLDEITRTLHLPFADLPDEVRGQIETFRRHDPILQGRRIAIIDDDIRNIFSLTAVLEQHNVDVLHAENGREGIELVKANRDLDAVLVDIMMPELDGYEVMRQIRKLKRFAGLPLIAVTAKAMKEDRDRCFEAGASDYLAKPLEIDELLSILRSALRPKGRTED